MTARRRQPPREVLLRLLEQVFEIQLMFAVHDKRSKSSFQFAALETAPQDQLQQQALARTQDKSIRLPVIVDHPYTCRAALFRIAELMSQMASAGTMKTFPSVIWASMRSSCAGPLMPRWYN